VSRLRPLRDVAADAAADLRRRAIARIEQARADAAVAEAWAERVAAWASTGEGEAPPAEVVEALRRLVGPDESAPASRVVFAAVVRQRVANSQAVACAELASACGCSRQYVHRTYGTLIRAPDADEALRRRS
jgi:hypothetical protein